MPDLTLVWDDINFEGDFKLGADDILTGDDLTTNIMTSLFTRPRWWANIYESDPWGCRLWELRRAKHTNATLLKARDYCQQALQWLLDDGVASAVDVSPFWRGSSLLIPVTITQQTVANRYSFVWKDF